MHFKFESLIGNWQLNQNFKTMPINFNGSLVKVAFGMSGDPGVFSLNLFVTLLY